MGETDGRTNRSIVPPALGRYGISTGRQRSVRKNLLNALAGGKVLRLVVSIRLFPLYLWNQQTSVLNFACVWVMTIARLELKIEVIGQSQRSMQ